MERCSPVEMRKNLELVAEFTKVGIDFVAIPVKSKGHKKQLIQLLDETLEEISEKATIDEDNQ